MKRKSFICRKSVSLVVVGALIAGSMYGPAIAQQVGEVTVVAPHAVVHKAGTSVTGWPIELITLSRQVSYSDLDLNTASGLATMQARVQDMAKRACAQLDSLYPPVLDLPNPANQDCVKTAADGAMAQVNLIVTAAAEK